MLQQILAVARAQPVIILTAHASVDRHQELVFAGATDFLAKPYEVEHLRRMCERVLHHAELLASCAEFQETEDVMHKITNRVYAAEHFVSEGRTWLAYNHLRSALAECREQPPDKDEWASITREFES